MGHNHNHNHKTSSSNSNVMIAFLLNFSFAIIEILGGILTNSTAIISDAVHDFGDSIALATSFVLERLSRKKESDSYTYGLKRLTLIGAFINIAVLTFGTYYVLTNAIEGFINPEPIKASGMLGLAILGIAVNGISVFRMKGSKNILDKSVLMHLMEDFLGWVAVLIVSLVMLYTEWYRLDSVLSFIIAIIIIKNIYSNIKSALIIMLQANPDKQLYYKIKEAILQIQGVEEIIECNFWTLDGENHVFTARVKINNSQEYNAILHAIKDILDENEIHRHTIEMLLKEEEEG
ncbi:MAG: cation diffusion facilitator family transporter [Aminipila sp.]